MVIIANIGGKVGARETFVSTFPGKKCALIGRKNSALWTRHVAYALWTFKCGKVLWAMFTAELQCPLKLLK